MNMYYNQYFNPAYGNTLNFQPDSSINTMVQSPQNQPYQTDQNWGAQYPQDIFFQGPSNCKSVALTFDDAPDNLFAPVMLDIFKSYNVKVTFFMTGECAQRNPDIVQQIARDGHIIGNHSYSHADLTTLPPDKIREEIQKTETVIQQITGLKTALFRPPYGSLNNESIQVILSMGYKIIMWNVDSMDWAGLTGPAIAARVVSAVTPGSIILMHNACGGTIEAGTGTTQSLPFIIEILRAQGYSFSTIPVLLNIPAYKN